MPSGRFVLGEWLAECQRCGVWYHASKIRREWTGLRVCSGPGTNDCRDPRHPQDLIRGVRERPAPPWTSPETTAVFTSDVGDVSEDDL